MELFELAENCLSCAAKPCRKGCPLGNDITDFIKEVKEENYKKAFEIMSETTVLMSVCGRICPHYEQCQGSCVRGKIDKAVEIGRIETIIGDMALKNGWRTPVEQKCKYNVAVVGAGPAGLTCSAFLRRNGIGVTIYERYDYLGGLLIYGVPEFRLPKSIVKNVVESIVGLGIDVKYNMELGKNLSLNELKDKYDAVFLACGANNSNKMDIPGEELDGVYGGNEILEKNRDFEYRGKTVIVSGGGNVAIDVARTAARGGAKKVIVVYRRSQNEMPAGADEVYEAINDGVEFLYKTNIVRICGDTSVERVEIIKTELVAKEGESRLSPVNIEGSNCFMDCDCVIMAIGAHADEFVGHLGIAHNKGRIVVNEKGRTSDSKVFAGGDLAGRKATVAWAARSGKDAAEAIIEMLKS